MFGPSNVLPPLQFWYLKSELLKRDLDVSLIDSDINFSENKAIIERETGLKLASEEAIIKARDKKYQAAMDQLAGEVNSEDEPDIKTEIESEIGKLIKIYKKWLYVKEEYAIVGPICAVIANFDPGDPDIWGVIGPSGSLKTEVLRSFGTRENEWVYPISGLTEHTFISGLDKSPETDVIPNLRGRLILIKDLTTILAKDPKVRSQIFADFRDITDGFMDKKFGNRVHKTYDNIHSSILFACTNEIEKYYSMYSCLGQRIMFMRPRNDNDEAAKRAEEISDHVKEMRKEIAEATTNFMKEVSWSTLPTITEEQRTKMREYYKFLAIVRTAIDHDYQGNIENLPEPELPTRIAKSVNRMIRVHAMLYGRDQVSEEDLNFGLRIVYDNIPMKRLAVLKCLVSNKLCVNDIEDETKIGYQTVRKILADLEALRVVNHKSEGEEHTNKFRVLDKFCGCFMILNEMVGIWEKAEN